jgi:hypothetical protein
VVADKVSLRERGKGEGTARSKDKIDLWIASKLHFQIYANQRTGLDRPHAL